MPVNAEEEWPWRAWTCGFLHPRFPEAWISRRVHLVTECAVPERDEYHSDYVQLDNCPMTVSPKTVPSSVFIPGTTGQPYPWAQQRLGVYVKRWFLIKTE